jgi:hypothetical protein
VSDAEAVIAAAQARARALANGDADELRRLMHPAMRWTTHTGDVLDRETYIDGNTRGSLLWRSQRLRDPIVTVEGDTAILTCIVEDEVEISGEPALHVMRLTQTWVRTDEGWSLLAGHAGPRLR